MTVTKHFDETVCRAYALDALDADTAAELERHMAICGDCADLVGVFLREADEEQLWNATIHQEAWRDRLLVRIAAALTSASGAVREALERWIDSGDDAGVRARARQQSGVRGWVSGSASMAPGVLPRAALGPRPTLGASSSGVATEMKLADGSIARLTIDAGEVRVRLTGRTRENAPPPVLLVPVAEEEPIRPVVLEWDSLRHEWRGSERVPAGEFDAVIRPGINRT